MMKTRLFASLVVVCAVSLSVQASLITLVNPSFEEPGTGKIVGWDGVPGWSSDTAASDSGVETGYTPTDGSYTAFLMGSDSSVYQLTSHIIGSGETYTLSVDARLTWLGTDLELTLYYDDSGTRVPAATTTVILGDTMATYTLDFVADIVPDSIGKPIGIELNNVTATGGSWLGMDNIRLDVVPEPTTIALLGLGGLSLLRRRRA